MNKLDVMTSAIKYNESNKLKYIAQDSDGKWFGYRNKPIKYQEHWGHSFPDGTSVYFGKADPPEDFTKTLIEL